MKQTRLDEKFIHALEGRFSKRSVLVTQISDILKIERDSANRRLSGKVQFSIREMGILARTLGVSVDGLIYDDIPSCSELLIMENPGIPVFTEKRSLGEIIQYTDIWRKASEQSYSEAGSIISSLPPHIYIHYPTLVKFIHFKWAYYIQNVKESFEIYQIPQSICNQIEQLKTGVGEIKYAFYIWNNSFILGVINDVKYFCRMGLFRQEEIDMIKFELTDMLDSLEASLTTDKNDSMIISSSKVEHYVSSVDIEISASYIWSEEYHHSFIFTFFMHSATSFDQSKCVKIRNWINSMKKVSTLISGSGEMARTTFLKYQRKCIESLE